MSIMTLVRKTIPFFITRILTYLLFGVIAFVFLGIMIGIGYLVIKLFGESGGAFIFIMVFAFLFVYGGLRFVERYFLYMVKIGHVAVIVELLRTGKIPEGKGQVAYGKEQVTSNFGTSNVAFALDKMVHVAVRQIQRWILRIGNVFSFIPGSKNIIGIINTIMSVSLNYIDEAIVSYIFLRKSEQRQESVWKSASDGVVLYAQSWKGILKTATGSVIFIYAFNIICFLVFVFPLMFVSKLLSGNESGLATFFGFLAIVGAYVLTTILKRAFIDPIVTIAMIRSYQLSIRELEPAMDLQQKLVGVSSGFKKLLDKSNSEQVNEKQTINNDEPVDAT